MKDKVIVTDQYFHQIVQMAFENNLLDKDNYYYKKRVLNNATISPEVKQEICQQIILTPNIVTSSLGYYEGSLQGEFIDFITEAPVVSKELPIGFLNYVDFNIISSILPSDSRMEKSQFLNYLEEYVSISENVKELMELEGVHDHTISIEVINNIRKMIGEKEIQYSKKLADLLNIQKYLWENIKPVWNCYEEINKMIKIAEIENAYLLIPNRSQSDDISSIKQTVIDENFKLNYLFRITYKELGVLPQNDFSKSLQLSRSSSAKDLRLFLSNWIESLINVDELEIKKLKKEINNALLHLNSRKDYNTISNLATYVGVPSAFLGFIHPLAGIPGVIVSLVGSYATYNHTKIESKYNWAMFGNK